MQTNLYQPHPRHRGLVPVGRAVPPRRPRPRHPTVLAHDLICPTAFTISRDRHGTHPGESADPCCAPTWVQHQQYAESPTLHRARTVPAIDPQILLSTPNAYHVAPAAAAPCRCRPPGTPGLHRVAPTARAVSRQTANASSPADLWDAIRLQRIEAALRQAGLRLPASTPTSCAGSPSLNKALQAVLSEFVRRTRISLPNFVELMRGQTADDYRPNKLMLPDVLRSTCSGYRHLDALLDIASSGVRAPLLHSPPPQYSYPANHKSGTDRYPVLVKNIRKKQDRWRCFVLDLDILAIWPEVRISPFGVVDKGDADPLVDGRAIHDLSFPEGASINDATDTTSLCQSMFEPCDAIAREVLSQQDLNPDVTVLLQAGDVASAFRNVCIHSNSTYLFGGRLESDNALVIDTSAAFGWSGSPASYGIVSGAIAYLHGQSVTTYLHGQSVTVARDAGPFNYVWVDDHINVATDIGSNCANVEQSLRLAMTTVLGHVAINEDKFTSWATRQKILGLIFDTVTNSVAMPASKIAKSRECVRIALSTPSLRCSDYRSLLGRLRHVATWIRPARPFLQRLCLRVPHPRRWQRVPVSAEMKQGLNWWSHILEAPALNGIPLSYFRSLPPPDVVVEMDASDIGLCAFGAADRQVLRYQFN